MAKPWATSHIGDVASGVGIEKRISGDVKSKLVELLVTELQRLTSEMEDVTLSLEPQRKTLGDPNRTRLGFNRTRGLMIGAVKSLDSVGSAAVVAVNENLESYLLRILLAASDSADADKMNTIKNRHLETALNSFGGIHNDAQKDRNIISDNDHNDSKTNLDNTIVGVVLTSSGIRSMAKNLAGMKIDEEALEDLLLVYYDHAADLQEDFQSNIRSGKTSEIKLNFERAKSLMMLGWLRRMLIQAGDNAKSDGSTKIMLNHVIRINPWE